MAGKFGTFGGVFTPSLLTILGVIMFLRFANVVGYAGLWGSIVILIAAKSISLFTSLSIASIATNMRVKGGGAYYLISRSLGVEFGGVIALFFFIGQAVAVTMYVVGFTEALFSAFPNLSMSFRAAGTLTNVIVFICVYIGAGWTIRLQYGILAILLLSVLSFFVGAGLGFSPQILHENLQPNWTGQYSFFAVFALFFPAVTGIMAGVNMSGDLKDPSRSIPKGTFAAVGFSGLIYLAITIMLAGSVKRADLLSDAFVMKDRAWHPALIYAGVICATLSSALGSMMGAPRILQAFGRDKIIRPLRWFGRGSGKTNEPRRAIIVTFVIAQLGVLAGDLNTIAPAITMFFLMTYATVNLACFYEGLSKNPSFRPTFKHNHWSLALLGALGCLGIMFLINAIWATAVLTLSGILYVMIARSEIRVKWGDVDSGLAYERARKALLRLEREQYHPKNWRPSVLVLSGGPASRPHLWQYGDWFTTHSGVVSIGQVISGDLDTLAERQRQAETILRKFILKEEINAFPVVVVEEDMHAAIKALLQCHGLGQLRPNTVLLGWSDDPSKEAVFLDTLSIIKKMNRSLILVACKEEQVKTTIPEGDINIWWNQAKNIELILLLAYLLKQNPAWQHHPIRILRPVAPKADIENTEREMRELLSLARMEAEIVTLPTEQPIKAIADALTSSAVLFTGFEPCDGESVCDHLIDLQKRVELPGDVILVYNAGDASLQA